MLALILMRRQFSYQSVTPLTCQEQTGSILDFKKISVIYWNCRHYKQQQQLGVQSKDSSANTTLKI